MFQTWTMGGFLFARHQVLDIVRPKERASAPEACQVVSNMLGVFPFVQTQRSDAVAGAKDRPSTGACQFEGMLLPTGGLFSVAGHWVWLGWRLGHRQAFTDARFLFGGHFPGIPRSCSKPLGFLGDVRNQGCPSGLTKRSKFFVALTPFGPVCDQESRCSASARALHNGPTFMSRFPCQQRPWRLRLLLSLRACVCFGLSPVDFVPRYLACSLSLPFTSEFAQSAQFLVTVSVARDYASTRWSSPQMRSVAYKTRLLGVLRIAWRSFFLLALDEANMTSKPESLFAVKRGTYRTASATLFLWSIGAFLEDQGALLVKRSPTNLPLGQGCLVPRDIMCLLLWLCTELWRRLSLPGLG